MGSIKYVVMVTPIEIDFPYFVKGAVAAQLVVKLNECGVCSLADGVLVLALFGSS